MTDSSDVANQVFDTSPYATESSSGFLKRKWEQSPSFVIGIAGCIGIVAYGALTFRQRKIRPSLFLIQLRVAAQGAVVGCAALGAGYGILKKIKDRYDSPENPEQVKQIANPS